jgi:hypothetical protein
MKIKLRQIKNSDDAVVGIIVAILLIGLLVMVVSVVQTVFIPNWMKEIEADHMDQVADQFGQLKFAIDVESALKTEDLPITAPITIGNKGFPILQSLRSYGNLNILENAFSFRYENATFDNELNIGNIAYSSQNSYYLDQIYIFEAGSIILSQDDGNIMTINPSFSIDRIGNTLEVNFTLNNIIKVGNKGSISGFGTYPIRFEYKYNSNENLTIPSDLEYLTITTSYKDAWNLYLRSLLRDIQFDETNITNAIDTTQENKLIIDFTTSGFSGLTMDFNFSVIDIYAQIAPGWIEE